MNEAEKSLKQWLATNLIAGCKPEVLKPALQSLGMSDEQIDKELAEANAHPYIIAAREVQGKLERREMLLKTLDHQKRQTADYLTIERKPMPPFKQFLEEYYYQNKPGLFSGGFDSWEARNWTPRKLVEKVGHDAIVEVEYGRANDPHYEINRRNYKRQMKFGDYIDLMENTESSNDFYITANSYVMTKSPLQKLMLETGNIGDGYLSANGVQKHMFAWIGPKGAITQIHHDLTNNMLVQVYGRKKVKMIPSMQVPYIYNFMHEFSEIDFQNPDIEKFPMYENLNIIEVEIEAGDCLFIPVGWWHEVTSLSHSISLTFTCFDVPYNGVIDSARRTYED